jgi:hypothetical protein
MVGDGATGSVLNISSFVLWSTKYYFPLAHQNHCNNQVVASQSERPDFVSHYLKKVHCQKGKRSECQNKNNKPLRATTHFLLEKPMKG